MKSYLALGDSYTIGELVPLEENFPNQTVAILNLESQQIARPKIIAVTGHSTDELRQDIFEAEIEGNSYDFVSLLIGVNNQYRGRTVQDFELEFESLLLRSIVFAKGISKHVFVLSIPDWGVTPFAAERDRLKIAAEIDAYNNVCKALAEKHQTNYLDITDEQRINGHKAEYLATDGLHPSGKEYACWAKRLAEQMKSYI